MAPVTSWCGGTAISRPRWASKAAATDLLKAVPPWNRMRRPTGREPTTRPM